ncbi:hypothetical protein [Rhizobium sp.]|uniref:hypothetical protein n=1 Tax=Rhizobium sp. TaxID=391 RepID=UPI0028A7C75D
MRFSPNCADDGANCLISKAFSVFPCQVNYLPALVKAVSLTLEVRRAYLFPQEVPDRTTSERPLGDPGKQ